jgi:transcriptional regulator with XRE-family HTH domain
MDTLIPQFDPQKLKAAREKAGISQLDMSKLLRLTKAQVSNFETGYSEIRSAYIFIWADACGVKDLNELMTPAPLGAFFKREKATA